MAIANFIQQGTYSIVRHFFYNHLDKRIDAKFVVYRDETKRQEITSMDFLFSSKNTYLSIDDRIESTEDLQNDSIYYILPSTTDTSLTGYANLIGKCIIEETINWEVISSPEIIYNKKDEKYYARLLKPGTYTQEYVHDPRIFTKKEWDIYFSNEAQSSEGNNLIKTIYTIIKSLPEFQGTLDC